MLSIVLKGTVHLNMKIMLLFIHPHVLPNTKITKEIRDFCPSFKIHSSKTFTLQNIYKGTVNLYESSRLIQVFWRDTITLYGICFPITLSFDLCILCVLINVQMWIKSRIKSVYIKWRLQCLCGLFEVWKFSDNGLLIGRNAGFVDDLKNVWYLEWRDCE